MIDFTEDEQLMSLYIYILTSTITVYISCKTIDQ